MLFDCANTVVIVVVAHSVRGYLTSFRFSSLWKNRKTQKRIVNSGIKIIWKAAYTCYNHIATIYIHDRNNFNNEKETMKKSFTACSHCADEAEVTCCAVHSSIDIRANDGAAMLFEVVNTVNVVTRATCVVATLHQLSIFLRASGDAKTRNASLTSKQTEVERYMRVSQVYSRLLIRWCNQLSVYYHVDFTRVVYKKSKIRTEWHDFEINNRNVGQVIHSDACRIVITVVLWLYDSNNIRKRRRKQADIWKREKRTRTATSAKIFFLSLRACIDTQCASTSRSYRIHTLSSCNQHWQKIKTHRYKKSQLLCRFLFCWRKPSKKIYMKKKMNSNHSPINSPDAGSTNEENSSYTRMP